MYFFISFVSVFFNQIIKNKKTMKKLALLVATIIALGFATSSLSAQEAKKEVKEAAPVKK